MKHLAIAAAACAVLVACGATETAEPVVEAVVESAEEKTEAPTTEIGEAETLPAVAKLVEPETAPVGPVKIEVNSDQVTAVANIEGAIFAFAPKLGEELKSDAASAFEKAKSIAAEDAGEDYFMPHDYQYDYTKSASAGDAAYRRGQARNESSSHGRACEDEAGAHVDGTTRLANTARGSG